MAMRKLNEHNIDVPAAVTVEDDGMFDVLVYRGIDIYTHDVNAEPEVYTGPFTVVVDRNDSKNGYQEAATLADAMRLIDAHPVHGRRI